MPDPSASTPLMEQYEGVRARYPGHLVLFRVGDFYETFGDDAKLLAKELEVVLTARSPDKEGGRTPMAGVPYHAVESYLGRLVQKGYKVAICDQVEDPKLAKGLVKREVTRVVTPGTAIEERILPGPDHNFLAAVAIPETGAARYAVVDVTTGEWFRGVAERSGVEGVASALAPFAPREVVLSAPTAERAESAGRAVRREFASIRVETDPRRSEGTGLPEGLRSIDGSDGTEADRLLVAYVGSTQPRLLPYVELVERTRGGRRLLLDAKTLRHLEIVRPMNPDDPRGPTLLGTWDATRTPAGRRTLAFWLTNPLADPSAIRERQEAVAWLVGRGAELSGWRTDLERFGDIARLSARLAARRIRPLELAALPRFLDAASDLKNRLSGGGTPSELGRLEAEVDPLAELSGRLRSALPDDLDPSTEGAHLFRRGFDDRIDRILAEETKGLEELSDLERSEQDGSGIRSLKIGYNQVFGYYFEVTRPNLSKVPPHFRRKQTLSGGERFTSDRLEEIEGRVRTAREEASEASAGRWEALLAEVERKVPALYRLSRAIGELDALVGFAHLAQLHGLVRPEVDDTRKLTIRNGRHPVLDRTLSGGFVPNDAELDGDGGRLLVLTGPNMSGKSTYMRQLGLLVVLAQAGAFVPASYCRIGAVDRLYTRMGFTDEIGRGKSSFFVEMSEVAEIVVGADDRSLVLLDEVGRGTSTFDGLALAWATLRYLDEKVRCRTVLATHYHQLTELVEGLAGARNSHLAVKERDGEVVFLHRLVPGSTDRSYGLHVARLAGLPTPLLQEADRLLRRLESEGVTISPAGTKKAPTARYTQAMLLAAEPPSSELERELAHLDLDRMTPIDALRWLIEARRRTRAPTPEAPAP